MRGFKFPITQTIWLGHFNVIPDVMVGSCHSSLEALENSPQGKKIKRNQLSFIPSLPAVIPVISFIVASN